MIYIDKEKIRDMLFACGIAEMEIVVDLIREKQDHMLKKTVDLIKMYENDPMLKDSRGLDFWYETKKRIDDLL